MCVWSLASVLHEAVLKREQRRADAGRDPDLVVDVLDVVVHRLRRHEQGLRHLTVGEPTDHKTEHFDLTLGQSSRPHAASPRRRVTTSREDSFDDLGVEPAASRVAS